MYKLLDRKDIQAILHTALLEKWEITIPVADDRFKQLFDEFLEFPCTFDFSKPTQEQTELCARAFLDSPAALHLR
jgi:hypothetical protein